MVRRISGIRRKLGKAGVVSADNARLGIPRLRR